MNVQLPLTVEITLLAVCSSCAVCNTEISLGLPCIPCMYNMNLDISVHLVLTELSRSHVMLKGVTPDIYQYLMDQQLVEDIRFMYGTTSDQLQTVFQRLRNNSSLITLHVPSTSSPVNMSALSASLTVNNNLQDLILDCDLDDNAMELLSAGLGDNKSVCTLTLTHGVTDTEARYLAIMLTRNTALQYLDLSNSLITDTGIHHLSEALKRNNSLTDLVLYDNKRITNTGAVALSKMLLVNKSLKRLHLRDTSVGEEGASALMESLLYNQVLTELTLPLELEMYCEQHYLFYGVQNQISL